MNKTDITAAATPIMSPKPVHVGKKEKKNDYQESFVSDYCFSILCFVLGKVYELG